MSSLPVKLLGVVVCDFAQEGIDGRYSFIGVHSPSVLAKQTGPDDFGTLAIAIVVQPLETTGKLRLRIVNGPRGSGGIFSYDTEPGGMVEENDRITFHHDVSVRHLGFGQYKVLFGRHDGELLEVHNFDVLRPPNLTELSQIEAPARPQSETPKLARSKKSRSKL